MILLRYKAAKLLLAAVFMILCLIALVLMFLHPEELAGLRNPIARLLSSGIGHDAVLPALILVCLALTWRSAATAMGNLVAIEAKDDSILVTDLWGTKRIAWARLAPVGVERTGARASANVRLIFRGGGRAVKIPAGMTDLGDSPVQTLLLRIEAMRCEAARTRTPQRRHVPAAAPAPARPAGFGRKRS